MSRGTHAPTVRLSAAVILRARSAMQIARPAASLVRPNGTCRPAATLPALRALHRPRTQSGADDAENQEHHRRHFLA